MKDLLLSLALIALPDGLFTAGYDFLAPVAQAATTAPALGDLSAMASIIADVQKIATTGDFTAAQKRIADFEGAWDDAQPTLQPQNPTAWGMVDGAADAALKAVRAGSPDATKITATLASLQTALADPSAQGATVAATLVSGIAITDANGHALPCESMLKDLATKLTTAHPAATLQTQITDLQTKALERCNADDDTRADTFSAQGLALLASN